MLTAIKGPFVRDSDDMNRVCDLFGESKDWRKFSIYSPHNSIYCFYHSQRQFYLHVLALALHTQ